MESYEFNGPEFTYYDLTVKKKDVNFVQILNKTISDFIKKAVLVNI